MFGIFGWIIFGLIAGVIAKVLTPGRDPGGFIVTCLLGITGAVVGGWLGRTMGIYAENEPTGLFMAVIGAVLVLLGYRLIARRTV